MRRVGSSTAASAHGATSGSRSAQSRMCPRTGIGGTHAQGAEPKTACRQDRCPWRSDAGNEESAGPQLTTVTTVPIVLGVRGVGAPTEDESMAKFYTADDVFVGEASPELEAASFAPEAGHTGMVSAVTSREGYWVPATQFDLSMRRAVTGWVER
jgi:hypothetical protein